MYKQPQYNIFEKADALVLEYCNIKNDIRYLIKKSLFKYFFLKRNRELKNIHKNERVFVIGNAPSLNEQDLRPLKNEITFMVNRSFEHEDYHIIKPTYHVIVDPKLATGQWPIEYLDIIKEKNPDVTLLLNAGWYHIDKFQKYKKMFNIYWIKSKQISPLFLWRTKIDLTKNTSSYMVAEQALTSAIYMGAQKIYVTGVEGNGIAYLMLNQDSHFSGKDPDYAQSTPFDIARAMFFNSRWIRIWYAINAYCSKHGIDLVNCTPRGLLPCLMNEKLEDVVKNK